MRPRLLLPPLLFALAVLLAAACDGGGGGAPSPAAQESPAAAASTEAQVVTYQTEDGVRIVADFFPAAGATSPPIVILLHQFGGSRSQWSDFVPELLEQGYAVLAPDLRSFGESTTVVRDGAEERYELTNLDDLLKDVAAALDWFEGRNIVDETRIAVIGASVGANTAYVASGAFPQIVTAIAMSPNAAPQGGVLLGADVPNFSPRSLLFMSDEAEAADAQALAENVADPVDVRVYQGATAHGVALLDNPQAVADILDWLSRNL